MRLRSSPCCWLCRPAARAAACSWRTAGATPEAGGGAAGSGQSAEPAALEVVVGDGDACALKRDKRIVCWADPSTYENGMTDAPPGQFTHVEVGLSFACALRKDGTLACWGQNDNGETQPPAGRYVDVSCSDALACAIRTGGSAVCWGDPLDRPTPRGRLSWISAGDGACGITTSGHVACFQDSFGLPPQPPPGL